MGRLPGVTAEEVIRVLKCIRFCLVRKSRSHKIYKYKEIGKSLFHIMLVESSIPNSMN